MPKGAIYFKQLSISRR